MKKIVFESITKINSSKSVYRVTLGNGSVNEFSSEKNAKIFLNKCTKAISQIAYEVVTIDSYVHELTNKIFLLNTDYSIDSKIIDNRFLFSKSIDNAFSRKTVNYQWFVFSYLNNAITALINQVNLVLMINKKRSDTITVHQCKSLQIRLLEQKNKLNNYSIDTAVEIVQMPEMNEVKLIKLVI